MAALLRKPRSKRDSPAKTRGRRPLRSDWFYWGCVVAAVAVVLGLYFWVTSARILKDPLQLEFGPLDPAFVSALGPIVGAEFTGGNSVRPLVNGDQFFPAMLEAIRRAEKTVTLETYIWSPGRISDQFIDALSERARNGVDVRVLVDGVGTIKFKGEGRQRLQDSGVRILTYGRERWYDVKPNINHRTHRKLLIVDGKVGFTGGMCIDDDWLGDAESPEVWRDTVVQVEGPVVRAMQAVFAANWLRTTSSLLLGEEYFPVPEKAGSSVAQCFMSGPGEGAQYARLGYYFAIASARKSIDISHAYFVPDELAIEMLLDARRRGVRIRIIVPEATDSAFGRAASRSRWSRLLEGGVEFHLYSGAMFHCKIMVVDSALVTVGSANFDNRSFAINDEVTLNVIDRRLAADFDRIFDADLKRAPPLDAEAFAKRGWWVKLWEQFAGMFRSQF